MRRQKKIPNFFIKSKITKGNIIHIPKTNISYIKPHKLEINEITFLFFNECKKFQNIEKYTDKYNVLPDYEDIDDYYS